MSSRRSFLAAVFAGLAFTACLTPTLPTPPPEAPDGISMSEEEGFWDIRGSCTPGSVVLVKNLQTGVITGREDADSDGRYFIRIEAELCDQAEVMEVIGDTTSSSTFFVIEPLTDGLADGSCPQ